MLENIGGVQGLAHTKSRQGTLVNEQMLQNVCNCHAAPPRAFPGRNYSHPALICSIRRLNFVHRSSTGIKFKAWPHQLPLCVNYTPVPGRRVNRQASSTRRTLARTESCLACPQKNGIKPLPEETTTSLGRELKDTLMGNIFVSAP
jgi:hypothetical protein